MSIYIKFKRIIFVSFGAYFFLIRIQKLIGKTTIVESKSEIAQEVEKIYILDLMHSSIFYRSYF